MLTPQQAYIKAEREGPSEYNRKAVLSNSRYSYKYARDIDQCPSNDTRQAVLSSPRYSYYYASYIDECSRDDTRNAVLSSAEYSYLYARDVDGSPRDDTRKAVLSDIKHSYLYAAYIDKIIFIDRNYDVYFVDIHNIGIRYIRKHKLNIGFMSMGCFCLDVL